MFHCSGVVVLVVVVMVVVALEWWDDYSGIIRHHWTYTFSINGERKGLLVIDGDDPKSTDDGDNDESVILRMHLKMTLNSPWFHTTATIEEYDKSRYS